ncbi:MAG TPA: pyrroloquinoline quinone-dependent dehydrogenase [Vicinamibacteria bacterium]|nr:pyrroloquinoline quinone-dependent dehydrogenase [Vicinamibacteria bacterium]
MRLVESSTSGVLTLLVASLLSCLPATSPEPPSGNWLVYGGDKANTKATTLAQIERSNLDELAIAWRWKSLSNDVDLASMALLRFTYQSTPLAIDGILYATTELSQVAAIDGASGKTIWSFDPLAYESGAAAHGLFMHRGLSYWSDAGDERLILGTVDGRLMALDPRNGQPVVSFGERGTVDLTQGLRREVEPNVYSISSPPILVNDVIVVGSSITDARPTQQRAPGDVRGFDVRTGEQLWVFHSIPQPGELGHETWEDGSWQYTGNTNVWTIMSADEELGYVYLPFSTPTDDWYGGHRPGDNLFAESLVCLDAGTGERVWHFQIVHHGVWDYDLPAAPNLVDIEVDGRPVKAVAQITKQGFVYVFDRVTGEPVWPIEEKPVPQSTVPGERTSPTQPFPSRPAPFERQGLTEDDLIDFTPELRNAALELVRSYDVGPLYTPPTQRGLIQMPGAIGGANWTGAAFDRSTNILYIPSISRPYLVKLVPPDPGASDVSYWFDVTRWLGLPNGLPFWKPPYGRITAIDLDTGEHVWQVPLGEGPRDHAALRNLNLPRLGWPNRGAPLLVGDLLFIGQFPNHFTHVAALVGGGVTDEAQEEMYRFHPSFYAFDKTTGELVWEMELPANVTGAPMTYLAGGKQFIVFAVGGIFETSELIALAVENES